MPVETATFITELFPNNPPGTDGLNQADDHLRLIKTVLQACFPSINAAVTATPTELNQLHAGTRTVGHADGSSGVPSIYFDSEPGLGLYRASAGHLSIPTGKRLAGNGATYVGTLHSFPKDPGASVVARGGQASNPTGTEQFVELDGSVYNISTFPDLGAFYGSTFGGNGTTTFGVPNATDTGRFLRSRSTAQSITVGTSQANVFKTHLHAVGTLTTGTTGSGHQHSVTISDTGHQHGVLFTTSSTTAGTGGAFGFVSNVGAGSNTGQTNTGNAVISQTWSNDGTHTHNVTGSTASIGDAAAQSGAGETRPESFVVMICAKT